MRKRVAIILMAAGLILIAISASFLIYNNYENTRAEERAEELMGLIHGYVDENSSDIPADPFDTEMVVKEIDGYGYVGYISVPVIDMELPVMSECDDERLKIAPCRDYGSTKTDNLIIAGHNYRIHFGYISNLTAGDIVMFTDMENTLSTYRVNSVEILLSTDFDKVKDRGDDLVLYTCNYSGTKRIVVRCSYVEN